MHLTSSVTPGSPATNFTVKLVGSGAAGAAGGATAAGAGGASGAAAGAGGGALGGVEAAEVSVGVARGLVGLLGVGE